MDPKWTDELSETTRTATWLKWSGCFKLAYWTLGFRVCFNVLEPTLLRVFSSVAIVTDCRAFPTAEVVGMPVLAELRPDRKGARNKLQNARSMCGAVQGCPATPQLVSRSTDSCLSQLRHFSALFRLYRSLCTRPTAPNPKPKQYKPKAFLHPRF